MRQENINFYLGRLLYKTEVGSKWLGMKSNRVNSDHRYETVGSVEGKPLTW
jgi:hypothetical protein